MLLVKNKKVLGSILVQTTTIYRSYTDIMFFVIRTIDYDITSGPDYYYRQKLPMYVFGTTLDIITMILVQTILALYH